MATKNILRSVMVLFTLLPVTVLSHTDLKESTPADGAIMATPPAHLELVFNDPVRLVRLQLGVAGRLLPIDFKVAAEPAANYRVETPDLQAGDFTVEWAAIGADGHTLNGSFTFVVEQEPGSAP